MAPSVTRSRTEEMTEREERIWSALDEVPDPEIPTVSVVELGMIRQVELEEEALTVEMLPTFVGCPALNIIQTSIRDRLKETAQEFGVDPGRVEVKVSFSEPWSTDRITEEGREKLRTTGFSPPRPSGEGGGAEDRAPAECPYCGSTDTTRENPFGPTLCRAIHYCRSCKQPFEQFKTV